MDRVVGESAIAQIREQCVPKLRVTERYGDDQSNGIQGRGLYSDLNGDALGGLDLASWRRGRGRIVGAAYTEHKDHQNGQESQTDLHVQLLPEDGRRPGER